MRSDPVGQEIYPFVDLSIQCRRNLRARSLEPCRKRLPLILAVLCALHVLLRRERFPLRRSMQQSTHCLQVSRAPRAERFCNGIARLVRAFSERSIRDLDAILWYMSPSETSWIGSLPGLLESPHQAIVRRHRLSRVDMALEQKGTINCCRGGRPLIGVKACTCKCG